MNWLQERQYKSSIFLPFLLLPVPFLGFSLLHHRVNIGNGLLTPPLAELFSHIPWNPTLLSSFTVAEAFPFQSWLRATESVPTDTCSDTSDPIQMRRCWGAWEEAQGARRKPKRRDHFSGRSSNWQASCVTSWCFMTLRHCLNKSCQVIKNIV